MAPIAPASLSSSSSILNTMLELERASRMPETPTGKQSRLPPVRHQMRDSAEKFNRDNRQIRQRPRSPPVPEADLNTSKLAIAFPGFSGVGEDVKPFSPNPFIDHDHKYMNQDAASKASLDVKRQYQARVRDENDVSFLGETSPSIAKRHNKNTRFGQIYNPKVRQAPRPDVYNPAPGLMQNEAAAATAANVSKPLAINAHGSLTSLPNGSTQQTLNLPQGSNLTDIFSGIVRQPPPVNAQPARPRASRFTSSKPQEAAEPKAEEIAVPANERHLLRSIDTLQARVAELEKLQIQWQATNSNLEQKTIDLQFEKKELEGRQRRDSGAGSTESGHEGRDGVRVSYEQLASMNKRLEARNGALVHQKDDIVQHLQDLEEELNHHKQQSATTQSTAARLYSDLTRLRAENVDINHQLSHYKQQCATTESTAERHYSDLTSLRAENVGINDQLAKVMADLAAANSEIDALALEKEDLQADNQHLRVKINNTMRSYPTDGGSIDLSAVFAKPPDGESSEFNINPQQMEASQFNQQPSAHQDEDMDSSTHSVIREQPEAQQPDQSEHVEQQSPAHGKAASCDSSYNITYVSYAGQTGSCVVRKDLENERKARHQLRQAEASKDRVNDAPSQQTSDKHARQTPGPSASATKTKPHSSLVDRTSSLLLDDFTFTKSIATNHQAADLPAVASTVLPLPLLDLTPLKIVDNETQHNEVPNTEAPSAKQAIEPAKKLTVSDEELDITIQDQEPTERPSQPPAAALAAVLESVLAERASQLTQLAKYQASYNRHDTALNRRQRKQLHAKIVALTESVDRKADQIYNLHDLVADQEQKGQSMTQNQVDNTLQSLGLELPWQGIASSTTSQRRGSTSSRSL